MTAEVKALSQHERYILVTVLGQSCDEIEWYDNYEVKFKYGYSILREVLQTLGR